MDTSTLMVSGFFAACSKLVLINSEQLLAKRTGIVSTPCLDLAFMQESTTGWIACIRLGGFWNKQIIGGQVLSCDAGPALLCIRPHGNQGPHED